jgi:hypothetical protein
MRAVKMTSLQENLQNTINDFMNVPQNSFIKIDVKRLRSIFEKYSVHFYPTNDYCVDEVNESVLKTLFLLYAQDEKLLKSEIIKNVPGLHKGVFVFGDVGVGKTDFFMIMKKVAFHYNEIYRYNKLNFHLIHAGHFVIDYKIAEKTVENEYFYKKHLNGRLIIDDFGVEPHYYGRELVGQLILDRYRSWKRNPDLWTGITTNLNLEQIAMRYGSQLPSRIVEMCNIIKWPGNDRRE